MAQITAGDLKSVKCIHPELGSSSWEPKSTEDANIRMGGFEAVDDSNNRTSKGTMIVVMNAYNWEVELTIGSSLASLIQLQELQTNGKHGTWYITTMEDITLVGEGLPVGPIMRSEQNGTIQFKLQGSGVLEQA